ncbi:MAG: hypothetical protein M0Z69_16790 [Actinomycetota bacterium]|nr:hypothetical protein [Actinomycetota bacterium]
MSYFLHMVFAIVVEGVFFGFLILLAASAIGAGLGKYLATRENRPRARRPHSPRYEFRRAQDYQKRLDRMTRRIERKLERRQRALRRGLGR